MTPKQLILGHLRAVDSASFSELAQYLLDQCQTVNSVGDAILTVEKCAQELVLAGTCEIENLGFHYLTLIKDN